MTNSKQSLSVEEAQRLVGNWLSDAPGYYDNHPANYETRKAIALVLVRSRSPLEDNSNG